jgi:hypothetical protein
LKSNIINLGDYRMDDDDRRLQALFAHPPLDDNGFSERVVRKLERRIRLRQLIVPFAALVGGVISAGPALQLINRLTSEVQVASAAMAGASANVPFVPASVLLVAALAAAAALRWLER